MVRNVTAATRPAVVLREGSPFSTCFPGISRLGWAPWERVLGDRRAFSSRRFGDARLPARASLRHAADKDIVALYAAQAKSAAEAIKDAYSHSARRKDVLDSVFADGVFAVW